MDKKEKHFNGKSTPENKEQGVSLVEVMVSMAIFSIFAVMALYIFTNNGAQIIKNRQIEDLYVANNSIEALLAASPDAINWNGASFTSATTSGVPSADASMDADSLSNIQYLLGMAGNDASISLSVIPDQGSSCPCAVTSTIAWSGNSQSTMWQVGY